jgi:hypothetical protein
MTNQPTTSRFVLRKGAVDGKWMIWDRERHGPARLERGLAGFTKFYVRERVYGLACEIARRAGSEAPRASDTHQLRGGNERPRERGRQLRRLASIARNEARPLTPAFPQ